MIIEQLVRFWGGLTFPKPPKPCNGMPPIELRVMIEEELFYVDITLA